MYMAEFKFKFIYKCIIICIDCFVVNKNFVLLNFVLYLLIYCVKARGRVLAGELSRVRCY